MKFSTVLSAVAASVAIATPSKTIDQNGEQLHTNVQYSVYNAQNQFNALTNTVNQLANVQTKNNEQQDQHLAWQMNGITNAVAGANSALSNVSMNCFLWSLLFKCHHCNAGCTASYCPAPVQPVYIPPPPPPPCATCPPGSTTIWLPDGVPPPTYPQRGRMFQSTRYTKAKQAAKDRKRVMNIISGPVVNHLSPVMKVVSQSVNSVSGQLKKYRANPYVNNEARKLLSSIETLADNSHEFSGAASERNELVKAANNLRAVLSY